MIKAKTKKGETDLSISGTMSDICADTVAIVMAIRRSLAENDPVCGEIYEEAMKAKLIDLAFGPETKKEETEADKDADAENIDEDTLKELASLIGRLLK